MPTAVQVWLLALGWSGGVGAVALVLLRLRPVRSVRARLVAAAAVGAVSVLAGVVGAARAMFLSRHDLDVVMQVVLVASVVSLALAVLAGLDVVRDVRLVRGLARALGGPPPEPPEPPDRPADTPRRTARTSELAEIERELLEAGRRLAAARERERALEAARRDLVAWVSHDLRTPLAGIRAMAEALDDGVAPDPARYHAQIIREVERLSRLVDDLFELSRLQAGSLRLSRQRLDLRPVVHDAVELGSALASGVALAPLRVPDAAVWVRGDAGALARVVTNLVANAVNYSRAGGSVEVRLTAAGGAAEVAVTDTCGGVPPDDVPRLFEPGWRGDAARTPGTSGGGLGLAVARGLARGHGGDVTFEPAPGGCRFSLRVPLAEGS